MAKQMTTPELVAAYNEAATALGLKTVKKFRDREAAETRTREILKQLKASQKVKTVRTEIVDWPFNGGEHPPREGTIGGQFLDGLKKGITMEELITIVENKDKENANELGNLATRARAVLRMLHTYNGFGIKQKGDTFYLVSK